MIVDLQKVAETILNSDINRIQPDKALSPELEGKKVFDPPIIGYGNPNDPYFEELQDLDDFKMKPPKEWLPSARTIISVFFPYSNELKECNKIRKGNLSYEWLHTRIDGQALMIAFMKEVRKELLNNGFDALIPAQDERFISSGFGKKHTGLPDFSSNWSERHVAYACGLGTFSLTRAMITEKGAAGRFGSILTSMESEFTEHSYKGLYDHCNRCGACIRKCPASAISLEEGKNNLKCAAHLKQILDEFDPYYGCSECQVNVPCGSGIPKKGKS